MAAATGAPGPARSPGRSRLLEGIRVLDFTHFLAGPTCTRILSDMGAEIVKLEPTPRGEHGRYVLNLEETAGIGAMFLYASAGKKSVCLDLKHPEGLAIAKALAAQVDVVVENFAPGAMQRLGLDYETLQGVNPSLVMASVSGFGQSGPLRDRTSYDIIGQAMSGVMDMTGEPDGPPQYVGNYIGDPNTGIHAALAVCACLFHRARTGRGQHIDIAQADALLYLDMCNVPLYALTGGARRPSRFGAHHFGVAPLGVFRGNDGYVVIQAVEHQWPSFARAIGREDLLTHPRFETNARRLEHTEELAAIIERWLRTFPANEAALEVLARARIPCAPVLSVGEAFDHPHTRARGMVSEIEHPAFGTMSITNMPFKLSETPAEVQGPAPLVGEHNGDVLGRYLGYSGSDVEALLGRGVLAEEDRARELRKATR